MEQDQAIYSGYLQIPISGKLLSRKSWHQKYCMLFKASKYGKDRLEVYENSESTKLPSKIITLHDCIKIIPDNDKYFTITTNSAVYCFEAPSMESMNQWLKALQSVAFPDSITKLTLGHPEIDNEIYSPSADDKFSVLLESSPASIKCGLEQKPYSLILTENGVELRERHDQKLLFEWPYKFIRKYGYVNGKFSFEAGRKCQSGEGIFYFQNPDHEHIFDCFLSRLKSKKKVNTNDKIPSNTWNRKSLPKPPLEVEQKIFPRTFPIHSETGSKPKTNKKITPAKPARKTIQKKQANESDTEKYDEVECRTEAWKSMSINEVTHTEIELRQPEDSYMSWGPPKKTEIHAPKILHQAPKFMITPPNEKDYNKLDFFPTKNTSNEPSYSEVGTASSEACNFSLTYNEYVEIDIEPEQSVDSNNVLNPKKIEKVKPPVKNKPKNIIHEVHNGDSYSLVTKAK